MRSYFILFSMMAWLCAAPSFAIDLPDPPPFVMDTYEISFGPQMEGIPGDPAFFIPINVSFSQPVVSIQLILSYDPAVLIPTLLAPNMFFQSFTYDISLPGRIRMSLVTDLPPPPYVPPIQGDTTVAWISCRVYSCDLGYDYLTHITYYDDPQTPFQDNFAVRENGNIITPPELSLIQGDIIIWHPDYGDINANTYPWEIGDAVTFFNFFMGLTQFNRRQYANSDCNRDCVQATISDLVFLLRTITGDTNRVALQLPEVTSLGVFKGTTEDARLLLGSKQSCEVLVESSRPLGGASFTFYVSGQGTLIKNIALSPMAAGMQLFYSIENEILRVTVLNLTGENAEIINGGLFTIIYDRSDNSFPDAITIASASFSDNDGFACDADYQLNCSWQVPFQLPEVNPTLELLGFPNPFNGQAAISFTLPSSGECGLAAFDMLGRKVKTVYEGYKPAGTSTVIWDGTDDGHLSVASGIYFLRLESGAGSKTLKMYLVK